jgi:hypothetical protein
MIHWSILQPSEIASLFILATIFIVFVTVVGVIRSGRRWRTPLHGVKIGTMDGNGRRSGRFAVTPV